jgi:hypothetical protein
LGVPSWSSGFNVLLEDKKSANAWMSSEGTIQEPFVLRLWGEASFDEMGTFIKSKETFMVQELGGKELVKHYNHMKSFPDLKPTFDKLEVLGLSLPTYQINHLCKFSNGFLLFITYEKVPTAHDIFKRFTKVFDQTYTRFLDLKKAEAINATHIRGLSPEDFQLRLVPYLQAGGVISTPATDDELAILSKAAPLIQERITLLGESVGMLSFLFVTSSQIEIDEDAKKSLPENSVAIVAAALEALQGLEDFSTDAIHDLMNQVLVESMGEKPRNAFGPLRTAISGRRVSPPLFESMEILGKAETLARLELFARG